MAPTSSVKETIDTCCICLKALGDTFIETENGDEPTVYTTVTLHQSTNHIAHKVHRVCIFEWFLEQLDSEPIGILPNDLDNIPFKCPLCLEKISLLEANHAAGVSLDKVISLSRRMRF